MTKIILDGWPLRPPIEFRKLKLLPSKFSHNLTH